MFYGIKTLQIVSNAWDFLQILQFSNKKNLYAQVCLSKYWCFWESFSVIVFTVHWKNCKINIVTHRRVWFGSMRLAVSVLLYEDEAKVEEDLLLVVVEGKLLGFNSW